MLTIGPSRYIFVFYALFSGGFFRFNFIFFSLIGYGGLSRYNVFRDNRARERGWKIFASSRLVADAGRTSAPRSVKKPDVIVDKTFFLVHIRITSIRAKSLPCDAETREFLMETLALAIKWGLDSRGIIIHFV